MSDDTPRLEITIDLDSDTPIGMYDLLTELPWFTTVNGWENFEAVLVDEDGKKRDAKEEAYANEKPIYLEGSP